MVKNSPAVQEMQEIPAPSLDWEAPLEKEMAPHSCTPAWRIPWTEQPGGPVSGDARVRHARATKPLPQSRALKGKPQVYMEAFQTSKVSSGRAEGTWQVPASTITGQEKAQWPKLLREYIIDL